MPKPKGYMNITTAMTLDADEWVNGGLHARVIEIKKTTDKLQELRIRDASGEATATLWLNEGPPLEIGDVFECPQGVKVREFKGNKTLQIGRKNFKSCTSDKAFADSPAGAAVAAAAEVSRTDSKNKLLNNIVYAWDLASIINDQPDGQQATFATILIQVDRAGVTLTPDDVDHVRQLKTGDYERPAGMDTTLDVPEIPEPTPPHAVPLSDEDIPF